jgi:TetR/AcrR family transcriptional regulator, mexJK operon transcriptional repressor
MADRPAQPQLSSRSQAKRAAILEAATGLFLENGYRGTSMDDVAARAAVSKQTVYKHFSEKERLFTEIVLDTIAKYVDPYYEEILRLDGTGDLDAELRGLARDLLDMLMQPPLLRLRRLVIGEAGRFPQLGRTYYERGPGRAAQALAAVFEQLGARSVLSLDDPITAALHFNWLVISIPINIAMFTGDDKPFTKKQLDRFAEDGVRVFLAAYGKRTASPRRQSA